jgi:hypothetical protein
VETSLRERRATVNTTRASISIETKWINKRVASQAWKRHCEKEGQRLTQLEPVFPSKPGGSTRELRHKRGNVTARKKGNGYNVASIFRVEEKAKREARKKQAVLLDVSFLHSGREVSL